jgi:hypothetical protein
MRGIEKKGGVAISGNHLISGQEAKSISRRGLKPLIFRSQNVAAEGSTYKTIYEVGCIHEPGELKGASPRRPLG